MSQVSYPGVYVEEVSSGVHTITSVATSIAAFFGRTGKGPLNKAVRCLSMADFTRAFGAPHPQSELAHAVRLFFANGGSDCYVVRLAKGATRAQITLKNLKNDKVLVFTAKAEGLWANTVRLAVDYNTPNPDESFNLTVIQEDGGRVVATETFSNLSMNPDAPRFAPTFVTQSSALVEAKVDAATWGDPKVQASAYNTAGNSFAGFSLGMRPLGADAAAAKTLINTLIATNKQTSFDISVNGSAFVPVTLPAVGAMTVPNHIAKQINDALQTLSPAQSVTVELVDISGGTGPVLLKITANSGNKAGVKIRRAASQDLAAALMLGVDQGGVEPTRWSNFRPAPNGACLGLGNPAIQGDVSTLTAVAQLLQNAVTTLTIDGGAAISLVAPGNSVQTTGAADPWYRNAAGASTITGDCDGVREKLRIVAAAVNATATSMYRAEVWGYHLVLLTKGGTINDLPGSVGPANALTSGMTLNVRQYSLGTAGTAPFGGAAPFAGDGSDGTDGTAPGDAEFLGDQAKQTGFYALDGVDLFNLMLIPGDTEVDRSKLWVPASNYCAGRRAFLVIDAPDGWTGNDLRPTVVSTTSLVNDLRAGLVKDHAAVFYPKLKFNNAGTVSTIGASGAVAGLMARTDATRGVWKAPAGIEADLRDVLGLDVKLTDLENGVLNKKGVNCLRLFPSGLVSWGARTLDGDDDFGSEWKYIPIRRLALNLEESLYRGTQWAVFEPNDEPLWAKIRMNLGAFMMSLFRQGAFQGSSPKDAFYVRCDATTTTQDDRNRGIVNIEVGFAPLKPAEFVVIRIQQIAGQV